MPYINEPFARELFRDGVGARWYEPQSTEHLRSALGLRRHIRDQDLAYNAAYDRLAAIGLSLDKQRVGPLPLADGWALRDGWPEVYADLTARYPGRWP